MDSFLTERAASLEASPTLALSALAKKLKESGKPIINLSVGEPDFPSPEVAKKAGIGAVQENFTRYTPADGIPELKQAIINIYKKKGLDYQRESVVVGTGAKQLIFNSLFATLNMSDEVLIPAPYWVSYPAIVSLFGGKVIQIPCAESSGFKLTPQSLAQKISRHTKWLILNSPNNPTGACYTLEELQAIGAVLAEYPHVWVLSDEIYEAIVYTKAPFCSFLEACPFMKERTLTISGVSKTYAMTGWRIGYGVGPAFFMRILAKIQSQQTSNPCSVAQKAALAALSEGSMWVEEAREVYLKRRNLALTLLQKHLSVDLSPPEGAFYAYVPCQAFLNRSTPSGDFLRTDHDVATYLLESANVVVVPGAAFGCSPYLRLSYAAKEDDLKQAFARLQRAKEALGAEKP